MFRYGLLLCLLLGINELHAARGTFFFLNYPQSPEAIGRGGLYFDPFDADPLSMFTRPGQIGVAAREHRATAALYTERLDWYLGGGSSLDFEYAARGAYYGFDPQSLQKYFGWTAPLSIAVGYNEVLFDMGTISSYDENGRMIGEFHSWERAYGLTLSGGLHHDCWNLGLGFTHKYIDSHLGQYDADAFATDFGTQVHWNILAAIRKAKHQNLAKPLPISVLLGASYTMTNVGGTVKYDGLTMGGGDPLPRNGQLGFTILSAWNVPVNERRAVHAISLSAGIQAEDELIEGYDGRGYRYTNPLGRIQPVKQFVQGRSSEDVLVREGWEIGLLDIFYWRRGEVRGGIQWISYKTNGFGVSLNGLFRLFDESALSRVDVQYHESVIDYDGLPVYPWYDDRYPDQQFRQVTLSWKY
ncbi:hypothetical protein HZB60_02445 [candidate division KSB1 bacterium]|nr:hypothetical protein [candidate division KSB1 bacterium]